MVDMRDDTDEDCIETMDGTNETDACQDEHTAPLVGFQPQFLRVPTISWINTW
jgi:hypothetical protein